VRGGKGINMGSGQETEDENDNSGLHPVTS